MKKIYFIILIGLIFLVPKNLKSEDLNLYQFKPASVDFLLLFQPKKKPIQHEEVVFITLMAEIDKKGKLKKVKLINKKDSLYLAYVTPYLEDLSFQPAKLENKKIKSILPIDIVFNRRVNSPLFKFPLLADTVIVDDKLFERVFTLNGMELPKVLSFPSYFSDFNSMDTSNRYPFVIEKISYENGEIAKIEKYLSTYDSFDQQIQSAILYADIVLPKIKKKEFSDELYLMVSFFPQISYPVLPFDANFVDSSNLLQKYRVRIINRFSQLLAEPIPKRIPSNSYSRKIFSANFHTPITILVNIDTLGDAGMIIAGTPNKHLKKSIRTLLTKLSFYPAINRKNELVDFRGFLKIEPFDELNIRISYLWMN